MANENIRCDHVESHSQSHAHGCIEFETRTLLHPCLLTRAPVSERDGLSKCGYATSRVGTSRDSDSYQRRLGLFVPHLIVT